MANEYVIEGPVVRDITAIDTAAQYPVNQVAMTATVGLNKYRIYRYVQYLTAAYMGNPIVISSVGRLLYSASNTNAVGYGVAVPQATLTSPTGSAYAWVQTGGYFDNTGQFAGVGIYTVSATVGLELYLGAAGSTSTVSSAVPVVHLGAVALTNASAANCFAFAEKELIVMKDVAQKSND
jgi:hypothetical protein